MEDKYKHKIITIPNLLSMLRLLLIPLIVWLYVVKKEPLWTTAVLAFSGITDIADGIIARKFHMISDFGKALDPVADKLTQIAVLFCLVTRFPWMLLMLVLLVIKEVLAGILSLTVIQKTGQVYGALWHGKVTTALLYGTMLLHLLWFHIPQIASFIMIGACTGMILLSAVLYSVRNIRILRNRKTDSGDRGPA